MRLRRSSTWVTIAVRPLRRRVVGVGRDGVETVAHDGSVVTLRDGKAVRFTRAFQAKADALQAAGPVGVDDVQEALSWSVKSLERFGGGSPADI